MAAKVMGVKPLTSIMTHFIPNTLSIIIVNITFRIPGFIFGEAFLSYVGLGVQPPATSWGALCSAASLNFLFYPYQLIIPAGLIALTMLCFTLIGDGLRDAYEYTKTLSKEEAYALTAEEGSKFREMVSLETPDDLTLVYTCVSPKPYFDTIATYSCLYPAPQALIDELGVDGFKAMDNETMWYNSCYTMTSYIQGNEKIFTKNPLYWDTDCKLFDTVTIKMVESNDVAFQLYQ